VTSLDLDLVPEPPTSPAVMAARQRRALVAGLGGGRQSDAPSDKSSCTERRLRATDTVSTRYVDPLPGVDVAASLEAGARAGTSPHPRGVPAPGPMPGDIEGRAAATSASSALPCGPAFPKRCPAANTEVELIAAMRASAAPAAAGPPPPPPPPASAAGLRLDDALVVPAGALMRGYLRCHALLLVGDVVGNVHCTAGPVVIRSGASLKGRLVAAGDVYICGTVGDRGGGAVITTRGKLTLAPGARVDGDVRSGCLDVYDGAVLNGAAKRCED